MTRKAKIQRAIQAIEARPELRGFAYFTGNLMNGVDRTKPCCAVGALVLAAPEFDNYVDILFAYNTNWIKGFEAQKSEVLLKIRNLLIETYGLTLEELDRLQEINDRSKEDRKEEVLAYLKNLLKEEDNG